MTKILIIENEMSSIQVPIDTLVEMYAGTLSYDQTAISQNIPWDNLNQYSAIFVDISLAPRTELDGYGILHKIKNQHPEICKRVAVITGNHVIENDMKEHGFKDGDFKIFQKPLKYMELLGVIQQ